ncbi:MAG: VWA domain-containing protein [Planctomycetes bacterium]|nr:VWA domain-containing protein [Planctomycetota bacterium]
MQALTNILAEGVSTVQVESRVELARWSAGNALLVGGLISAVGLYAVWWMYRREARGNLSKLMRSTLATCRVAVLVLLGVIGLEPILVKYDHRRLDAQTLVLVDESASMSLSDHYRDTDEAKRVMNAIGMIPEAGAQRESIGRQLLSPDGVAMLKKLADKNDVKLFTFSDALKFQEMIPRVESHATNAQDESAASPVSSTSPISREFPAGIGANGSATDVGIAIRGALDAAAGAPIAGVVVLTDGGFNHGEAPGIVARLLSQRQLPVFAVGIGDPAEPVNARVTHVSAPRSAFKNDPFSITVRVEASNSTEENLKVELFEAIDGGQREGLNLA